VSATPAVDAANYRGQIVKFALASAMLLCASSLAAHADSFTFTSTSHTVNSLTVSDGGKPVVAAFSSGSAAIVSANGSKANNTSNCAFWTAEPGSQFTYEGACTTTEPNGNQSSIVASCVGSTGPQIEADCWGGMTGLAGTYKGKTGTISWHQKGDGQSSKAWGVGQWND
jgi:hypothetical protein